MKTNAAVRVVKLLLLLSATAGPACAALTTFSDRAAFLAATGASDLTGPLPNLGSRGQQPTTVGGVTFTPIPGHDLWFGPDWTPLLPGYDMAINDTEDMDVSFAPAFSLGFDFADPTVGGDSTFTVTLFRETVQVGQFVFRAAPEVAAFVGVWSDTAFDRVQIRETSGGIEDQFFGHFYSGTSPLTALRIRGVEPSQVEVSWSTNATGFGLQTTTNLPSATWSSVTNAPQIVADRFTVVLPAPVPLRIFRLLKP